MELFIRLLLIAGLLTACACLPGCSKKLEQEAEPLRKENQRLIEEKAEGNAKFRATEEALKMERERHASEILKVREESEHNLKSSESKAAEREGNLKNELGNLRERLRLADAQLAKQQSDDSNRLQAKLADL